MFATRSRHRTRIPVVVVGVALVATACTSGSPAGGAPTAESPTTVTTSTSPSTTPASPPSSVASSASGETAPVGVSASHPCGGVGSGHYRHVVWIWMENKPYASVMGNKAAPYENGLAKQCGLAADYRGIRHPSLPNYLAATGGSTFGVTDDSGPSAHRIGVDSIFGQLARAGLTWRSYEESMPVNCDTSTAGKYATKHNPAAYFAAIRSACAADDVPLEGNLERDIAAGTLPSFSLVTPNMCDDTHNCPVRTGDTWLATWIPKFLAGPNYQAGDTLLVLTWDEGVGAANRIPTIVVGPTVPANTVATERFDHYALLRTTEDLLGLGHLGAAASAPSMAAAFGL